MNCIYCNKNFSSWKSVRGHVSSCPKNTNNYLICTYYGFISYAEIESYPTILAFRKKYPNISYSNGYFTKLRKYKNLHLTQNWSKEAILSAIKDFYAENNRIPRMREFTDIIKYPSFTTVKKYFGSWNKAVEAAGFIANIQNGFGYNTYGKDGELYDSFLEAYFVDNYLYEKYIYEYYKPYPNGWFSDFYLPEQDLYIEIDGGCRPHRIKEKINFCNSNKLNLLVLTTQDIFKDEKMIRHIVLVS